MPSTKKCENDLPEPSVSLIDVMRAREIGEHRILGFESNLETLRIANSAREFHKCMSRSTQKAIDEEYHGIISCIQALRRAVEQSNWEGVEAAVGDIILTLLDSGNSNTMFHVTRKKKQQRECFVRWGGMELLLRLFEIPFVAHNDARNYANPDMGRKCEVWNEILVILREVCFAIPSLTDKVFGIPHIVFLFTMLSHQSLFDNTMNLLEDVLASRDDTFQLSLIPNAYSLFDKFSARQLAHFCRVLSLLLFEPEDRLVVEGSAVLHSLELLHLRRNRMAKNFSGVVERNQSLIAEMPHILSRLVQILRVVNFGPNLADLISHNIVTQMPITSDILTFCSSSLGISDWDHFSSLESIVAADETRSKAMMSPPSKCGSNITGSSTISGKGRSVDTDASLTMSHARNTTATARATDDDDIIQELLSSFSPNSGSSGSQRAMDLSSIINVMQVARSLGIADMTPLGEQLLDAQRHFAGSPLSGTNDSLDGASHRWHGRSPPIGSASCAKGLKDINPKRAKKELQFHAMLLSPHQIELIFVLCTLLSGRRKIQIQQQLAALGLEAVLLRMFDRMSWTAAGARPPPPRHIHGPSCECDPESTFRVQFLRLVHNFYDRDFLGNSNKFAVLSAAEKIFVQSGKNAIASSAIDMSADCGLLDKTMSALSSQEPDSVYRFWLSACVENFLRGSGRMGQLLVARAGLLTSTVKLIVQPSSSLSINQVASTSLQTCFDLLGELVKCNQPVLEMLDASLTNEEFNRLLYVIMNNLVDSNVFVRSLLLSMEILSCSGSDNCFSDALPLTEFGYYLNSLSDAASKQPADRTQQQQQHQSTHPPRTGYLTSTWIQFEPVVLSHLAIDIFKRKPAHRCASPRTVKVAVERSSPKAKSCHGMLSAGEKFFKDIRRATKHFLKFGESVSDSGMNVKENRAHALLDTRSAMDEMMDDDMLDVITPKVDEYYTPPEQPVYDKQRSNSGRHRLRVDSELLDSVIAFESSRSSSSTSLQHSCDATSSPLRSATTNGRLDPNHKDRRSPPKSPSSLTVPHSLLRISLFLSQEKVPIVLRLMGVVSLRSVNHENVCCLNTVLSILLIENRRGSLGAFLQQVRSLADEELSAALPSTNLAEDDKKSTSERSSASEDRCYQQHCATCQAPSSPGPISDKSVYCLPVENELTSCSGTSADNKISNTTNSNSNTSGADLVFRNFRLLLWYWQEYYLRRGRDRLSIEFSTRIPFRFWLQLVELLCADDGSPTALLQQSICLPQSPYTRSVCGSATFSMPAHENVKNYN